MDEKEPAVAALLNFFLPGFGYVYVGRLWAAFCVWGGIGFCVILSVLTLGVFLPIASAFGFLCSIIGAIDAYGIAKKGTQAQTSGVSALVRCLECAEQIQAAAKKCRFCQAKIVPSAKEQPAPVSSAGPNDYY